MTIVTEYQNYMRVAYFAALQGVFDFNGDYRAYCAMAACDEALIAKMAKNRRKALGVTAKQVKFAKAVKGADVAGSLANARATYDEAMTAFYADFSTKNSPMHLKSVTGKKGTKTKEGTQVGNYTVKRPKKVQSAFGDADNSAVFS